jgi:hypothetical protein
VRIAPIHPRNRREEKGARGVGARQDRVKRKQRRGTGEHGNVPVYADGVAKATLFSGLTAG